LGGQYYDPGHPTLSERSNFFISQPISNLKACMDSLGYGGYRKNYLNSVQQSLVGSDPVVSEPRWEAILNFQKKI